MQSTCFFFVYKYYRRFSDDVGSSIFPTGKIRKVKNTFQFPVFGSLALVSSLALGMYRVKNLRRRGLKVFELNS